MLVKLIKMNNEDYLEFKDRFGKSVGKPMKLENWIETQKLRYDPKYIKKFLEKNKEFRW